MKPSSAHSKKVIIFDFDGTVADSFDIFLEALAVVIKRSQPFTIEETNDLRRSSIKEIIKKLGIKPWQMPLVLVKGRREINNRMERVQVFGGIPEALKKLASRYSIYILSTNSEENIASFLKKHQIDSYIARIYGNIGLMGKAKSLKKLQKKEALRTADCLYIGDETRDIEAARKVGLKCVAVKWGYGNPDTLESYSPDALVDTPRSLPTVIRRQWPEAFNTAVQNKT